LLIGLVCHKHNVVLFAVLCWGGVVHGSSAADCPPSNTLLLLLLLLLLSWCDSISLMQLRAVQLSIHGTFNTAHALHTQDTFVLLLLLLLLLVLLLLLPNSPCRFETAAGCAAVS
jgi:hypothetical protein